MRSRLQPGEHRQTRGEAGPIVSSLRRTPIRPRHTSIRRRAFVGSYKLKQQGGTLRTGICFRESAAIAPRKERYCRQVFSAQVLGRLPEWLGTSVLFRYFVACNVSWACLVFPILPTSFSLVAASLKGTVSKSEMLRAKIHNPRTIWDLHAAVLHMLV